MREPCLELALITLRPGASWITRDGVIEWLDKNQTQPSEEEIQAEIIRLQQEYEFKEYQRQRVQEYPDLRQLADALYWAKKGDETKMNEYIAKCEEVKNKYPKPQ